MINQKYNIFPGLDGELKTFDINSTTDSTVGQHDNAIRCVEYSNDVNAVRPYGNFR